MSKRPIFGSRANQTDWQRVDALSDEDIVFDEDSPATNPEDWADAVVHRGLPVPLRKTRVVLSVDDELLAWFKAQGPGYQQRMHAALKAYKEVHETNKSER
jgi:uncharacterized protein (DUF4415 family)